MYTNDQLDYANIIHNFYYAAKNCLFPSSDDEDSSINTLDI